MSRRRRILASVAGALGLGTCLVSLLAAPDTAPALRGPAFVPPAPPQAVRADVALPPLSQAPEEEGEPADDTEDDVGRLDDDFLLTAPALPGVERASAVRGVVRTPDGAPLQGARVELRQDHEAGHQEPILALTDGSGRFAFEGLPETHVQLRASARVGGRQLRFRGAAGLPLAERSTLEVELDLHEVQPLHVEVRYSDGRLVDGAFIEVRIPPRRPGGHTEALRSDRAPVGLPFVVQAHKGVLEAGESVAPGTQRVVVTLPPSRPVTGTVAPLSAELDFRFEQDGSGLGWLEAAVAPDAHFSVDLPVGARGTLRVEGADGEAACVVEADTVDGLRLELRPPPRGRLEWRGEACALFVLAGDDDWLAPLWKDGRLAPGEVELVAVDTPGNRVGRARVTIRDGETTVAAFPLAPATRVRGRLLDPRGRPAGATLYFAGRQAETGADGRFELSAVPIGAWVCQDRTPRRLERVAARFGAARARLPLDVVTVGAPGELDLGDLVVKLE
jgi:hypothetical protein